MKQGKAIRLVGLIVFLILFATGCMYPAERKMENQLPVDQQVSLVQDGIDQYYKDTGVLPIKTKDQDTPIFEKYVIDFSKMMPKYIPYVPGAAFEKGGPYLFVLTHPESKPTVRLMDLRMVEQVGDIQDRVSYYFQKNKSLPVAGVIQSGFFQIDPRKIGIAKDKLTAESPVTGDGLPVIMTSEGRVGIDYQQDLQKIMKSHAGSYSDLRDLRDLFPDNSLYVPVKSFPYALVHGEPRLVSENN